MDVLPIPDPVSGGGFHVEFHDARSKLSQWFVEESDARAFYDDLLAVMRREAIRDDVRSGRDAAARVESGDELATMRHERDVLDLSATLLEATIHKLADALEADDEGSDAPCWTNLIAEARALAGEREP